MVEHSNNTLPSALRPLAVVAHPDDESFGLGAVIHLFAESGSRVHVLSLTSGEASTLGAADDLAAIRSRELRAAADILGAASVELGGLPDGGLAELDQARLDDVVLSAADAARADLVITFDPRDGVSGHPDHEAASRSAMRVARHRGIPVVGWALPERVTSVLGEEFGITFAGYPADELHYRISVDRTVQHRAIRAHASQAVPGSVLWRRLELLGDTEYLRRL